ncbi:MAG TPA: o-succinylbenzoate--CoA ligase [Myxococcota bacterium]|nr:o-succinylbenzoate--CoA ligase [Myxococcota bacterium]
MNLPVFLAARAALSPASPALACGEARLDFAQLFARANAMARGLRALGVREGDGVAALLPNGVDLVALVHAAQLTGAALVPLNLRLVARELAFQLADAAPRVLVHGGGELAERARAASAGLPGLRRAPTPICDACPGADVPLRDQVDLAATAAVVYTSGTTGEPKGAELSHGAFLWSALGSALHLGHLPGDRWLACLPLAHVGGLAILYRSALSGTAVTVHERFDPVRVAKELDDGGITLVSFVASMLERVLDARGDRPAPPELRCVLVGGGPCPARLLARARALGFPIATTYGLTEAASQVATLPLERAREPGDSTGRPLFCTELRIVSPDGVELPRGAEGEIAVRGPTVMTRYLRRPEATAHALRGGWLHTGDVGRLEPSGDLVVLDRRSDLVVSGGENVYPAEVEAALREHPAVADAAVAGEPDPAFGARVAAWLVLRAGCSAGEAELVEFCRARLAGYKLPRRIRFVPALPRTESGKLLRRALLGDFVG